MPSSNSAFPTSKGAVPQSPVKAVNDPPPSRAFPRGLQSHPSPGHPGQALQGQQRTGRGSVASFQPVSLSAGYIHPLTWIQRTLKAQTWNERRPHGSRTTQLLTWSAGGAGEGHPPQLASLNSSSGSGLLRLLHTAWREVWEERSFNGQSNDRPYAPRERPPPQSQHPGFSKQQFMPQRKRHTCGRRRSEGAVSN